MAIQKINIEQFLYLSSLHPVLDVRSPGEFTHAHVPGACSLPLFTDEERKVVGTAYKQQSRQTAIKTGLDYFGIKMRKMVEQAEGICEGGIANRANIDEARFTQNTGINIQHTVLVHCWRGGMRSAGVAWLLDLYGFKVYTLSGGYKVYRRWAREQFDKKYFFNILGGYTGSGKTRLIHELKQTGKPVIDLEALASHKGSAFGSLGQQPQPSQEMFENMLANELYTVSKNLLAAGELLSDGPAGYINGERKTQGIYLEDESQRIGLLNIPNALWHQMRNSPISFLDIPFEERLNYLTGEYGSFEKEKLVNAIIRIQKRLGGLETKNAINHLLENNQKECFRILLSYYDKCYKKGLHNRESLPALLNKIPCPAVDTKTMIHALIKENTIGY